MKIKLDENLPAELIDLFASRGHDIHSVQAEGLAGHPDNAVLHAANIEHRILFTQDLDFSDLRKFKPGTHSGVALIRLHNPSRRRLMQRLQQILDAEQDVEQIEAWSGCFVVIGEHKLRVRRP